MYDIKTLKAKKIAELIEIAEQIGIKNLKGQKKQEIIDTIVGKSVSKKPTEVKSESDKKPIHAKSVPDNSNKPYRNDRNLRNSGNKNHHNKNFSNRKDDNFNKDNRRKYKEPDFEFDGIIESEGV